MACEDVNSKLVDVVMKLILGRDSEARFGQDVKFKFSQDTDVWLSF